MVRMPICFCSGYQNVMYADLYDGDDNIATKMIEAGFADRCSPSLDLVRFNDSNDSDATFVPSTTTDVQFVLIPG